MIFFWFTDFLLEWFPYSEVKHFQQGSSGCLSYDNEGLFFYSKISEKDKIFISEAAVMANIKYITKYNTIFIFIFKCYVQQLCTFYPNLIYIFSQ